jgi:hypothetical protein
MTRRVLERLMVDVGIRMDAADVNRFLFFFAVDPRTGFVSREEYAKVLRLSDYEIDLIAEKAKKRLVASTAASAADATAKPASSSSLSSSRDLPSGKATSIRENKLLSSVFASLNKTTDGVLSLEELMDMASRLEIFVTEEEAHKLLATMAPAGTNKVAEADFIRFMRRRNDAVPRKAHRLRDVAAMFRRWLARGSAGLQPASLTDRPRSMFSPTPLTLEK